MHRVNYLSLRAFSSIEHFLRERLTLAGWIALATGATGALAGFDTSRTVTYQLFTLLAALLGIALVASLAFRARARASRELPRYAIAGVPFVYRIGVRNTGARLIAGALVRERFADPRPDYAAWRATREPGEERRNWFDRNVGYFRWRWYIDRRLPERRPCVALPALRPGELAWVDQTLTLPRRGRFELAGISICRPDPFGLMHGLVDVALPARVIALPKRYPIPRLALAGARRFQRGGVSLASSVGDSEEFIGLREYRPGDPLHRLHWKSFARTGRPIVKEFQDEFFERHALVLDTVRGEGEDAVFEDAVAIAASFVYTIDTLECLLDLLFVAQDVEQYTTGRGQMQADHMLEILAGVAPSPAGAFDALAKAVLGQRERLTSCILVLLGFDAARRALFEALIATGLEVRALLVCTQAPAELPPGVLALHPGRIEAGLSRLQ